MQAPGVAGYEEQKRVMNLSLVAAILLLAAKVTAAAITGSSAIYSDAAESVVHFLAVAFAVWALRLAHIHTSQANRPARIFTCSA